MSASYMINGSVSDLKSKVEANRVMKVLNCYFNDGVTLSGPYEKKYSCDISSHHSGHVDDWLVDLVRDIWKATHRYVPVSFSTLNLDAAPWESYDYDQESYKDRKHLCASGWYH